MHKTKMSILVRVIFFSRQVYNKTSLETERKILIKNITKTV